MGLSTIHISKDIENLGMGSKSAHSLIRIVCEITFYMIVCAQTCCWCCITTSWRLYSATEESIWTLVGILLLLCNLYLRYAIRNIKKDFMADIFITKFYLNITIFTFICYIYFMVMIDVPMYIRMHSEDLKAGKKFNTILQGLLLSMNCDVIEYKWSSWAEEAYWQTPYFAMMVWAS